ncbi:MAG: PD-(D/E)XK nuclease family protein [Hyphomonadaceae bacterium]|nr:PD-(D/E)XK nuclease family protein [Hyphomonadaceae bacterium]MBC6411775.1 PD-(D/E)XK nuclease family protein [Hyphomonadaceae bacterium]
MNRDNFIPTLTHATERDIDLVLVQELHASRDFVRWMAAQVNITRGIARWDVRHSQRRTRNRREIDIFVDIRHEDKTRTALLIENKIDATEQPDQAESYREEVDVLTSTHNNRDMGNRHMYDAAAAIIVCPQSYRAEHGVFTSKFDTCLSYESIRDRFLDAERRADAETVSRRYQHLAGLFDQAIHKHRRGYTPIPDTKVGDFNAKYVQMLREMAPEIIPGPSMLKPANPRESTSMIFDKKTLAAMPEHVRPHRFSHELGRGSEQRANYVAVTFPGWGAALPAIRGRLIADTTAIGAEFSAKTPNKSRPNPGLVLSLPTRPVDNQGSFSEQQHLLADGIEKAVGLRNWLIENIDLLRQWRSLVDQHPRSE